MPFFSRLPRPAAVFILCAALPPALLVSAVAAAASTLFEAAPLLIGAEIAERWMRRPRRLIWFTALAGCGCGPLPGALSIPAALFCTLSFGLMPTLLRYLAALSFLYARRRLGHTKHEQPASALDQLGTLALLTCAQALLLAFLRNSGTMDEIARMPPTLLFVLGAGTGLLMPCTLGALGMAAGLRATLAPFALGIICSTGLFPAAGGIQHQQPGLKKLSGRFAYMLIACAFTMVSIRGGATLLHPKFIPLLVCGAFFSALLACARPTYVQPTAFFAALLMSIAPILTMQAAPYRPDVTSLEDLYPGQTLRFTGEVNESNATTTLIRYVITCCRADAFPLTLRLDSNLTARQGKWAEVEGIIVRDRRGILLHVHHYKLIPPPNDPFTYR